MSSDKQLRLEAAARGETRYAGRECRKCGASIRYVSNGACCECNKQDVLRRGRAFTEQVRRLREAAKKEGE